MSVAPTVAPPTAELLIARARAIIPHIAACAAEARQARRVSESVIAQIEEAGLFRILQPARWGGYEMKPETYYDVLIAHDEGDMSVGWVYGVLGVHPWLMGHPFRIGHFERALGAIIQRDGLWFVGLIAIDAAVWLRPPILRCRVN